MPDDQTRLLAALQQPNAYPHETGRIRVIQTHISWVFLTGRFAYKIKKAVALPFVDFSTLERRERYCRDELRLNRRLAPELYLDVVPIGLETGSWRIGATPAAEFAVKMVQFPDSATADELIRAEALGEDDITVLAERIAVFHGELSAAAAEPPDAAVMENLDELERVVIDDDASRLGWLAQRLRRAMRDCAQTFAERQAQGFVRECHGDLHLGNIARVDGRLVPFDCLEFDRALRTIDVIDEVAFLFMDLAAHRRWDLGFGFLNRYLEIGGEFAGLKLLRLFAAHRALVRAKVAAIGLGAAGPVSARGAVRRYLDTARAELDPPPPVLLVTFGLSGSGKTTIARQLAPTLRAVHIRSDIERKRLHGIAPGERTASRIGEDLYAPAASDATYARLESAADAALAGGVSIIVDAACLTRSRRDGLRAVADRRGAGSLILRCEAEEHSLRERVRARARSRSDASEADEAVLAHQLETVEPIAPDEAAAGLVIDTDAEVDIPRLAAEIAARTGACRT